MAEPLESVEYATKELFLSGAAPLYRLYYGARSARMHIAGRSVIGLQRCPAHCLHPLPSPSTQSPPCLPPHLLPPLPAAAGVVYPQEGATTKESGRRLDKFGPLASFSIDFSDKKAGVQVVAVTAEGYRYLLTRPAATYKKVFAPLADKAAICFEVSQH